MPLKCKANPSLTSPSRVHGDRIQFWTTDDLHGETPFDDAELGEDCVRAKIRKVCMIDSPRYGELAFTVPMFGRFMLRSRGQSCCYTRSLMTGSEHHEAGRDRTKEYTVRVLLQGGEY